MIKASRFELIGGHPVLDLVNTVSWRGDPARRIERIPDFDALLTWSAGAGIATADERGRLSRATRHAPEHGVRACSDTHKLREHLHDAFTSADARRQQAIALLWPELTGALRHARPEGLPVRATIDLTEPRDLPRRLAVLALYLLDSEDVRRVRVCADLACGWVFLDHSRNHTRRWCASSDCGNRNRVRRHQARHNPR